MAVGPEDFKAALSRFASGVTVVTTKDSEGRAYGITVSAFCSVSLDPPLVLICIERSTLSHSAFGESGAFVVNVLREGQADVSERFASPIPDRFAPDDPSGNAIYRVPGALAYLECRVLKREDAGDHSIFVAEVEQTRVEDGTPLVYFRGGYHRLGVAGQADGK
jgi:flavin reductase ActVB